MSHSKSISSKTFFRPFNSFFIFPEFETVFWGKIVCRPNDGCTISVTDEEGTDEEGTNEEGTDGEDNNEEWPLK
jgi:hypothetical protein